MEKPSVQPLPEFNVTYSRNVPRRTRVVEKTGNENNYTHGNSAAYPVGTPLGPPLPPDLPANLPGGKSNYVQPGYANRKCFFSRKWAVKHGKYIALKSGRFDNIKL